VHTQTGEVDPLVVLPHTFYRFIGNEGNHIYLQEEKKNIVFHLEIRSEKFSQKLDISKTARKTKEDERKWYLIQVLDGPQRILCYCYLFHLTKIGLRW